MGLHYYAVSTHPVELVLETPTKKCWIRLLGAGLEETVNISWAVLLVGWKCLYNGYKFWLFIGDPSMDKSRFSESEKTSMSSSYNVGRLKRRWACKVPGAELWEAIHRGWERSVLLWSGRFGGSDLYGRDVFLCVSGYDCSGWGKTESELVEMGWSTSATSVWEVQKRKFV